jgi:hypothetical protein
MPCEVSSVLRRHLLKAQELDDAQADAGMETQTPLVGPNGRVELRGTAAAAAAAKIQQMCDI